MVKDDKKTKDAIEKERQIWRPLDNDIARPPKNDILFAHYVAYRKYMKYYVG